MPTIKELLDDVHADLNAVSAAQKGMAAVESFAKDLLDKFERGANEEGLAAARNLVALVEGLKTAIPANVVPASAGPVGKSPHEQYLEQASAIVQESLGQMKGALDNVQTVLQGIAEAVSHANTASAAIQSPDLRKS